jgi:hypothetical protein
MKFKVRTMCLLCLSVGFNAVSANDGLPPMDAPKSVDCGVKVETQMDRKLEKIGPEFSLEIKDGDKTGSNTSFGIAGAVNTMGANLSDENLQKLILNQSTYQEVVSLLGKPGTVMRRPEVFMAGYLFTSGEVKNTNILTSMIPGVGGLLAKKDTENVSRKVDLRFDPQSGVLISCTKSDRSSSAKGRSTFDLMKDLVIK